MFLWSLVLGPWGFAQAPLSDLVFTVGTTTRDVGNNDHSYVMIGSSDALLLRGKEFAVYGKPGAPGSPSTFSLRGNLIQQTDPNAINALLNQSVVLGQNLSSLATTLNGYLRREPGITNQSLGQKVATLFRVANTNADAAQLVALLAVNHPGLKMAMGHAFTEQITGVTTYEVREVVNGTAGDVIGRVTMTPGAPVVLPAPGRPFQVMTNHPDDDLTIRLRWGTSVELRRLSLLNYGFNVWRIPRANAEAAGFHLTPPTLAQLYSNPNFRRINDTAASVTKEFTDGAGAGAADDPSDRTTFFISDNNNRLKAGGVPFNDGEEFYHFVTARDILGRDGFVSPGRLTVACRRIPPLAPTDPSVKDEVQVLPLAGGLTTNEQRLRISWEQNTNVADAVTHYWVYRWPNPTMVFSNDYVPVSNRIGVVTHVGNTNRNSFLDDGATAPKTPGLSNFWYTIRAVSMAVCDPLLSPHSPPASGVLRMREGPAATTNFALVGSCGTPVVIFSNAVFQAEPNLPARKHYRFVCERTDPSIAWVRFTVTNSAPTNDVIGPIYFPAEGNVVEFDYSLDQAATFQVSVTCVVGTSYGQVSRPVTRVAPTVNDGQRWIVRFSAGQVLFTAPDMASPYIAALNSGQTLCVPALEPTPDSNGMVSMRFNIAPVPVLVQAQTNLQAPWIDVGIATPDANGIYVVSYPNCLIGPLPQFRGCVVNLPAPAAQDCVQHVSHGSISGVIAPIQIHFGLTRRTREYRLYRQINDGPLTLMSQGGAIFNFLFPNRRIVRTDDAMPVTPARICYYVQLLDEHGNPSPMTFIGCKDVKPPQLPTPVLAEPTPAGNTTQPQVSLNWFCPTAGVYRFKVFVERIDQPDKPSGISGIGLAFSALIPKGVFFTTTLRNKLIPIRFSEFYFTAPVGPGFGPGPQFTMNVNLEASVPYRISVAAVDAQGSNGPVSQAWEFTWQPPVPRQIVNWPFRDLPPVGTFHPGIQARLMTNMIGQFFDVPVFSRDTPVGVRIGAVDAHDGYPTVDEANRALEIWGNFDDAPRLDPNVYLFRRNGGSELILPVVLYRQQVTNASFPRVSGALMQVSPLIERIAFRNKNDQFTARREVTDKVIARSGESERNIPGHMNLGDIGTYGIYLLDAQPVMSGATYRYFVVRFKDNREMDMVIPAGEVTIP